MKSFTLRTDTVTHTELQFNTFRYANWIRTMADLQSTGCTKGVPDSHGHLNMSGYCWEYDGKNPEGALHACNLTNSYCCLPTPPSANPKFPKVRSTEKERERDVTSFIDYNPPFLCLRVVLLLLLLLHGSSMCTTCTPVF